jgi:hypothetical protein
MSPERVRQDFTRVERLSTAVQLGVMMKNASIEYPELVGKVVKQVRFANDEEFTALVIEFKDDTHASFHLESKISLKMQSEISRLKGGNITAWKKLKSRSTGRFA